jgi:hypothetical protein
VSIRLIRYRFPSVCVCMMDTVWALTVIPLSLSTFNLSKNCGDEVAGTVFVICQYVLDFLLRFHRAGPDSLAIACQLVSTCHGLYAL